MKGLHFPAWCFIREFLFIAYRSNKNLGHINEQTHMPGACSHRVFQYRDPHTHTGYRRPAYRCAILSPKSVMFFLVLQ